MKDKFEWWKEEGNLYIRCKSCYKLYTWKPYKPKNWKGKAVKGVGKFDYPNWELYSNPSPCKDCACFYQLWDWTND